MGIEHGILPLMPKKDCTYWACSLFEALFESTNFNKCLKQGKCWICSIWGGHVPKKALKTGELLNIFNPEGKYGRGIEHGAFPLRIEHKEHIEHLLVLSTSFGTCLESRKEFYTSPPSPPFWPEGIFRGEGGVYLDTPPPPAAGILYAPPLLYTPPPSPPPSSPKPTLHHP